MSQYHYDIPPLSELLSPVEIEALAEECNNDERIFNIIEAWGVPDRRAHMQEMALEFIAEQLEFQIRDENTVYIAVYGPKGKGKSEVAARLSFFLIGIYFDYKVNVIGVPRNARSPSEANDIFGEVTLNEQTVVMVLDETERQVSTASKTNLDAFIQNVDTMRNLKHSLVMITINKRGFGGLLPRCELIFRALFKDKVNRVNWCLMYVNDFEGRNLIPKAVVGIPLHPHKEYRKMYEIDKRSRQVELTGTGRGRSVADPKNVIKITDDVIEFLKEKRITSPSGPSIRELLLTEIPNTLIGEEKDAVVARTQRLMAKVKKPAHPVEEVIWVGDKFDFEVKVWEAIKANPAWPDYYEKCWSVLEVEKLVPRKDTEKIMELVGASYERVLDWKRNMKKDKAFQGWLAYYRGEILFEQFLRNRFVSLGITVTPKPKVIIDGKELEEDLLVEKDGNSVYLNAKCGVGHRRYVPSNYHTAYRIKNELQEPALIVYFDYGFGVYSVFEPVEDGFNVGSKSTREPDISIPESTDISDPVTLAALLNNIISSI